MSSHACHQHTQRVDYLLWVSFIAILLLYVCHIVIEQPVMWLATLSGAVHQLVHDMWIGVVSGVVMLSLLSKIPREFVMAVLGRSGSVSGIMRATMAGVMLDLCSHGILMVASTLYKRGASVGQVMAFLIASPWNSFSLMFILFALIGFGWTLTFIVVSMVIAIISGLIFDQCTKRNLLPPNPHHYEGQADFAFWKEAKHGLAGTDFTVSLWWSMAKEGMLASRLVLRWLLFGILLAAIIRTLIDAEQFGDYFGPTLLGLGLTMLMGTVIEVCSEGSTPIAADILTRAGAPGNSLAFLMTGVSTDYTEIMVLKDSTKSWKIALFLPLITLPQVVLMAWLLNKVVLF